MKKIYRSRQLLKGALAFCTYLMGVSFSWGQAPTPFTCTNSAYQVSGPKFRIFFKLLAQDCLLVLKPRCHGFIYRAHYERRHCNGFHTQSRAYPMICHTIPLPGKMGLIYRFGRKATLPAYSAAAASDVLRNTFRSRIYAHVQKGATQISG